MRDILVVCKNNNFGLTKDARLLVEAIRAADPDADAEIVGIRQRSFFAWLMRRQQARTALHIERAFPRWFTAARRTLLVPNQERFPARHIGRLKKIDLVLAKSRHALDIFRALGARAEYLGFTSQDRSDGGVAKDWSRFLHLAGGSTLKGTEDVVALWKKHPEWPVLTLVQNRPDPGETFAPNIRVLGGYLDDAALRGIQNSHGIHLCPSRAEGWGHHIVEAMSVGALVVCTDAPPMNEHLSTENAILVAHDRTAPRRLGTSFFVDMAALEKAVLRAIAMPDAEKRVFGDAARRAYERIDADFRSNVKRIFSGSPHVESGRVRPPPGRSA